MNVFYESGGGGVGGWGALLKNYQGMCEFDLQSVDRALIFFFSFLF